MILSHLWPTNPSQGNYILLLWAQFFWECQRIWKAIFAFWRVVQAASNLQQNNCLQNDQTQEIKQQMSTEQKQTNVNEFNKFLNNNTDFLEEKYAEHFKNQTFKPNQFSKETSIKYIYDVFSFSKYETDEKLNKTLKTSLLKNVTDFANNLTKSKKSFNIKSAVQLLKFCIQNNEMFSVKYDKKDKKIKTENNSQVEETKPEENEQEREKSKEKDKSEERKVESPPKKKTQQNLKQQEREEISQKSQEQEDEQLMNEFQMKDLPKKIDPELIKKNLKNMFEFYCKQQQNVGANSTFDRIGHQCSTMNLGKMLTFAKLTGILNDKIEKALIVRKFKLIAEGKREIEFDKFYELIQVFATMDESLIPKLGVDQKQAYKQKLKYIKKPFDTQDSTTRQVKRENIFIPVLTSHSGKPSDALIDEMKARKKAKTLKSTMSDQKNQAKKSILKSRYEQTKLGDVSQMMSPKQLANSSIKDFDENLKVLQKIVDDDGDEEWLQEYRLPVKKNHLPPRSMPRKQRIVTNLKKRVQQLQRTQTRRSVHLEKRKFNEQKAFSKGLLLK